MRIRKVSIKRTVTAAPPVPRGAATTSARPASPPPPARVWSLLLPPGFDRR